MLAITYTKINEDELGTPKNKNKTMLVFFGGFFGPG
jgi:hypothetical protein